MTTIDLNSGNNNKGLKQSEPDNWTRLYLPAICAAVLMGGVLFLAVSFSRKSPTSAKINAPAEPAVTAPVPVSPVASIPEAPKKKVVKKHRPANATYVNSEYGVSFSYPRKYSLQSGDKIAPLPVSYLSPDAIQVAGISMPDSTYPQTDFTSAILNVSFSKEMTPSECMEFVPASAAGEVKPELVKLGANEYSVFEQINGAENKKSDLKYFHLFKNNACYEFAVALNTTEKAEDMAQVDHGRIFQRMEKILATAEIKDLQPTDAENADLTPSTGLPIADLKVADTKTSGTEVSESKTEGKVIDKTENAQVVTPEHK